MIFHKITGREHQAFRKASWVPCFQNSNQSLPLPSQFQTHVSWKSTENFTWKMRVSSLFFHWCYWHCGTWITPLRTLWWAHCEKDESLGAAWWHPQHVNGRHPHHTGNLGSNGWRNPRPRHDRPTIHINSAPRNLSLHIWRPGGYLCSTKIEESFHHIDTYL